ncbi:MAG TPA: hypothetical protein VKK79_01100 [Candidatus Lokiarchaeia archaeon]|nr:hypothetical protein [Candidatus Lokiarchaeia archaeon]
MNTQITREQRRREKLLQEEKHFEFLLSRGLHPFDVADELTHVMLGLLRAGLISEYPHATEEEIKFRLREEILAYEFLKKQCRGRKSGRI